MHRPTPPARPATVAAAPRLTAVMARGRVLARTLPAGDVAARLVDAFGWDHAFEALLLLPGEVCERALLVLLEGLVVDQVRAALP